jgi:phosphoglycolate phosphatase-like HAD superfamily hydrolase
MWKYRKQLSLQFLEPAMIDMRYKCLVIDHDDTSVNSTPFIHYPAFLQGMKYLRPEMKQINFEQYMVKNFDPGLGEYFTKELLFDKNELSEEIKIWRSFTDRMIPEFFPGFLEFVNAFRYKGGIVAVVSHSLKENIERDYKHKAGFMPDMVFGWEQDENRRKPHPYPVIEIIRHFNLDKNDILVLDDLKPGLLMAKNANVKFAAAGWAYDIPVIKKFMKKNGDFYFSSIEELKEFILS